VPRLGGIALVAGFAAAIGIAAWRGVLTADYSANDETRLLGILIGAGAALIFGLIDDRFSLRAAPQFAFQFLLSGVALTTLLWLERFHLPFIGYVELSSRPWGPFVYVPLTFLWFMGMVNTVNWLDGLGGLAGGVGAILCLVLALHMNSVGQPSVALLPLALLGALIGFLPHNLAPSRVFLGSGGAYFLGYTLSALGLVAGGRIATVLLVMGLPIVDMAWQIFDRLRRRRSPTQGGRDHLHFRRLDAGLSERSIVLIYWGFCAAFGIAALAATSPLHKLLALLLIGVGVVLLLDLLSRDDQPVE
jgi:UDP-GlcNAc:undecaprenyl-phosphate GlcNAc-1-phosphate transferase